jgi:D-xylono/L-arabinono-1,4-lactonase
MEPELIADYACVTGENPLWHPDEGQLYWTDIPTGRIFRYDPAAGWHEQVYQGDVVGGFTVQGDGALLLFMAGGAVKVWRDGTLTTVVEEIPAERHTRFNDVIADPAGRVFCGTISPRHDFGRPDAAGQPAWSGRLYRLDPDGTLTTLLEGVGASNGLGFTPDRRQLYYTDSPLREISLFDYDQASGAIMNRRLWVRTPDDAGEGAPDGLTVDAEGYVWSARWDGGCLVRYAPDGIEERRVRFPARKVSSATFGGPEYADLYVTTAGGNDKAANGPGAGALFRLRPGVRGVPEFRSRTGL